MLDIKQLSTDSLDMQIKDALRKGQNPMHTIYWICRLLGLGKLDSRNANYRRIYRRVENMVDKGEIFVARGTRDPNVYVIKSRVKVVWD